MQPNVTYVILKILNLSLSFGRITNKNHPGKIVFDDYGIVQWDIVQRWEKRARYGDTSFGKEKFFGSETSWSAVAEQEQQLSSFISFQHLTFLLFRHKRSPTLVLISTKATLVSNKDLIAHMG